MSQTGAVISKSRIALVGGGGFIGHNLALRLRALGAEVAIIDSFAVNNFLSILSQQTGDLAAFNLSVVQERIALLQQAGVDIFVEDARDYHKLTFTLKEFAPTVLVHLAAIAHSNLSNKDPYTTFDHNLRTLENALDACRSSIQHFIFFSSSMVYGDFTQESVTEETPCNPIGIYGTLKYAGEKIVIAYNQVFDLPYTIIRPSALYGPRCISRRVGQVFIESAISGQTVTIDGDGSDRLDFTYIDDLVQGVERVIENERSKNETFNITYGASRSVRDFVDLVQHHIKDLTIVERPRDKLSPKRGTLCIEKAKEVLGYQPKYSIDQGVPLYVEWYRQSGHGTAFTLGANARPTSRGGTRIVELDGPLEQNSQYGTPPLEQTPDCR